jgi:hypothetical protein
MYLHLHYGILLTEDHKGQSLGTLKTLIALFPEHHTYRKLKFGRDVPNTYICPRCAIREDFTEIQTNLELCSIFLGVLYTIPTYLYS